MPCRRRVGFLTRGSLWQPAAACNAEIGVNGRKGFATPPNRAKLRLQMRHTCPMRIGEFERH
jgi:hypothetical protein